MASAGAATLLGTCALLAGCGGSEQTAGEPHETFPMELLHASFPTKQAVARPATLSLVVRNSGSKAIPNVAVTVDSFNYHSNYPQLAASSRPVWAIERGPGSAPTPPVQSEDVSKPGSGQTAYVNTWALGPLAAGATRTFRWQVVAVTAGRHVVSYSVGAGLAGRSGARASKGSLRGSFAVNIAAAPSHRVVNPNTGKVETGSAPASP
ncbi:MAG TPA: hypothetical protein VFW29_03115 [Solirubrobacteraceae bacterium]|nr:hypothetical protein [Solirubrobacteraceae bacterium]